MTNFTLPKNSEVNKFIPKQTFIKKISNGKTIFSDIEKITWAYKLSTKTINIPSTNIVEEIHIFDIVLKSKKIPQKALEEIKKLIPYPILFNIKHQDSYCFGISLLNEQKYYFSEWNEDIKFNFIDTNLEKVYQNIIKLFLRNIESITDVSIDFNDTIQLDNKITILTKDIELITKKRDKEKQFNKKTQLNQKLKILQKELKTLINSN
ncbi:MAG: DUF4391 domain-containing protein [Epsilonproteobacteria bacterium]|nr:MAG: DUF4391 domain-containing protein [Campylobacterota bacterium]